MARTLLIARRELAAYVHTPIAYVVGVLFLVVQGFSFWAVVEVLASPERPAPYGAVLETHFGGTFLYWTLLFAVVALLSMRLVAHEKATGTWESLHTTLVGVGEVIVGKWLGALAFYAALWLPTLLYLVVLSAYAPAGGGFDPGPVASAYLGVLLSGAAFLALGLAASAATRNQIVAAVVAFVGLLALLLIGQSRQIAESWMNAHPTAASVIAFVDVREHMGALARGELAASAIVFFATVAAVGLGLANMLSVLGRTRSDDVGRRGICTALIAVIGICAAILVSRHPSHWDVTRSQSNSLDARTTAVLDRVAEPVEVLVLRAADSRFDTVFVQVQRVLARMQRAQPLLRVRAVDPTLEPRRLESLSAELAIPIGDLRDGGAVVFQTGQRRRAVDLLEMASFARDQLGAGRMASFRAEEAFATALLQLVRRDRPVLCVTRGHGELPLSRRDGAAHWGAIGDRVRRDGGRIESIVVATGVPAHCRAVVIAGLERPFDAVEAKAVQAYLSRGGRLLLAVDAGLHGGVWQTGLELVLAELGVGLPRAVVLDPAARIDLPLTWVTSNGYGEHPVSSSFQRRRITAWQAARPVTVQPERGTVLVETSASGWGETDIAGLRATDRAVSADERDLGGPVPVAVAAQVQDTGARAVVVGSARSLSSELVDRKVGAGDRLAASALAWLSGATIGVRVGDKRPEYVRLVMTDAQLSRVFLGVVVVIPGAVALMGLAVWWWRRRRG